MLNLAAYTLSQRVVMFAVIAATGWVGAGAIRQSVPSRSSVSLSEFTAAYRAHPSFGHELGDSPLRVLRSVGLVVAVLVALPEILGML